MRVCSASLELVQSHTHPRSAYHYCIPAPKIMAGPLVRDEDPDEVDPDDVDPDEVDPDEVSPDDEDNDEVDAKSLLNGG